MSTSNPAPPAPVPAPLQDSLSDSELMRLSEKVKPLTWLIKVVSNEEVVKYASGFAIKIQGNDVFLLTCAHIFDLKCTVEVRRLLDEGFTSNVTILLVKPTWDIAALVVKEVNGANHVTCPEFADGSIDVCETLLQVGHISGLVWSVLFGRAAYGCVPIDLLRIGSVLCRAYEPTGLETTPDYRVIGDMWNSSYFDACTPPRINFLMNLIARIPIIQCAGLLCKDGCHGGPVFNTQGKLVGMMVGEIDDGQIAIHVSLLKRFVKDLQDNKYFEVEGKGKPLDGGQGSKVSKKSKRKKSST